MNSDPEGAVQFPRVYVALFLASVQPLSVSVSLPPVSAYVQAPTFSSPFSVQATATPSHESELVHVGVPENVMVVGVDVQL
jgi:hypothetical protein